MQLDSSFSMNTVLLLTSDRKNDGGQTSRLDKDLKLLSEVQGFAYWHEDITSKANFIEFLNNVNETVRSDGMKPILHLHMHGSASDGLEIGATGEFISWEELTPLLRNINISLKNNLCVISTACYGLHLIRDIEISKETPYFCLIAAQEKISFGYIDDRASGFYKALFDESSIDSAHEKVSDIFKYYHSEKMLVIVLGKYILQKCKGRTKNERKERLITEAITGGIEPTKENLKELRKLIKEHMSPDQELLDRYVQTFLIGKALNITMDDILDLVEASYT